MMRKEFIPTNCYDEIVYEGGQGEVWTPRLKNMWVFYNKIDNSSVFLFFYLLHSG